METGKGRWEHPIRPLQSGGDDRIQGMDHCKTLSGLLSENFHKKILGAEDIGFSHGTRWSRG